MPDRILELIGATEGFGEEVELTEEVGDTNGVDLSQALAAIASLKAL